MLYNGAILKIVKLEILDLTRYALLCGSAPAGFTQKKINEMHDFLVSEKGGSWNEKEIAVFPNGISEEMLCFSVENLAAQKTEHILLYFCTLNSVSGKESSFFLGGEEIKKSAVQKLTDSKNAKADFQVIYDWDAETESDESLGYEKV